MIRTALLTLTLVAGVAVQAATQRLSVNYGAVGVEAGRSIDLTNEFRVKYTKYDWDSVKLISLRVLASSEDTESTISLQMGQEVTDPRALAANSVTFRPQGFADSSDWKLLFTGATVLKGAEAVVEISKEPKRVERETERVVATPRASKRDAYRSEDTYGYDSYRYGRGYGYGRYGYRGYYGLGSPYSALGYGSSYGYGGYGRSYGLGLSYGRGYGYGRDYDYGYGRRYYY